MMLRKQIELRRILKVLECSHAQALAPLTPVIAAFSSVVELSKIDLLAHHRSFVNFVGLSLRIPGKSHKQLSSEREAAASSDDAGLPMMT
jgi:hypothetical protein